MTSSTPETGLGRRLLRGLVDRFAADQAGHDAVREHPVARVCVGEALREVDERRLRRPFTRRSRDRAPGRHGSLRHDAAPAPPRIWGTSTRHMRTALIRLRSMLAYQSSSVSSSIGLLWPLPTLFTTMSTVPRGGGAPARRAGPAGVATSATTGAAVRPAPTSGGGAFRGFSGTPGGDHEVGALRREGRDPSRPMPWLPPVTTATRPSRPRSTPDVNERTS